MSPDTISEASFSGIGKNVDRKLLEATWKHPCFRGSQRQKRAASKAFKRACASEREKEQAQREREAEGCGRERGRGRMRAKSGGMSLVSSCLHKAAPHQIAFVLNIWIGGYGAQGVMAGRDATEKKRKGEADTIPHILRRDHPPPVANVRERERETETETKGGRMDEAEGKSKTGREFHGIRHNSFPRYSPQFREPILQLPPSRSLQIYRTSLLSVRPSPLSSLRPDIGFPIT